MSKFFGLTLGMFCLACTGLQADVANIEETKHMEEESRDFRFHDIRYMEDWSHSSGYEFTGPYERLNDVKNIELNESGSFRASIGGQARARAEIWDNYAFGDAVTDEDEFALFRFRLHLDLQLSKYLRIFAEGKSALSTARELPGGKRTMDVDQIDLQNGFVELIYPSESFQATLRGGRQELTLAKQRLLGANPWSNSRHTFDALKLIVDIDNWNFSGFFAYPVMVEKYDFNESHAAYKLWGATASTSVENIFDHVDFYFFAHLRPSATFSDLSGVEEDRYTIGAYADGSLFDTAFYYNIETAYQWGDIDTADSISAWMAAAFLGYRFDQICFHPDLFASFTYATGDEATADGEINTFSHLYPSPHGHLGYIDAIAMQNIVSASSGAQIEVIDGLKLKGTYHWFWRESKADGIYNAQGNLTPPGASTERYVGSELDLIAKYQPDDHWTFMVGYSHFCRGEFLIDIAAPKNINFGYLGADFVF